jgi:hypothetical protein
VRRRVSLLAAAALAAASLTAPATPAGAAPMAGPVKASASAPVLPKGNPPKLTGHGPKGVVAPKGEPVEGGVSQRSLTACSPNCYSYSSIAQDPVTPQAGISWNAVVSQPYVCGETDANCPQTANSGDHSLMEVSPGSASTIAGSKEHRRMGLRRRRPQQRLAPAPVHVRVGGRNPALLQRLRVPQRQRHVHRIHPVRGHRHLRGHLHLGRHQVVRIQHYDAATCGCTGGWWTSYKGSFVGVFPDAVWTNPAATNPTQCGSCTAQTFTSIDANTAAFGEIASEVQESCTDMGDGRLPLDANSTAVSSLTWANPGGTVETTNFNNSTQVTSSTNWAQTQLTSGSNVTGQRFGGPGYNSVGQASTAGYTGHCAGRIRA